MVTIDIIGDEATAEYQAAEQLANLLRADLQPQEEGRILIVSNVTCFGQKVKDIDLVVFAVFPKGIKRRVRCRTQRAKNSELEDKQARDIRFRSFCLCIEVKDHSAGGVDLQGSRALVQYKGKWSDVTNQSEQQKYSLIGFLKDTVNWSPYVTNLIWFRNLTRDDLPGHPHNWMPNEPTLSWMLHLICQQNIPSYFHLGGYYSVSCTGNDAAADGFDKLQEAADFFSHVERNLGKLTRERLEKITRTAILKDQDYAKSIGEKLVVVRGRAGTGKTIKLLHIAHDLCVNHDQRCLILTYNKALVSDIRRLLALAKIDTDVSSATVAVRTVHSFIRELVIAFDVYSEVLGGESKKLEEELDALVAQRSITRAEAHRRTIAFYDSFFFDKYEQLKESLLVS